MKAAITGASGLVGGNLAVKLVARGADIICTRRANSRTDHLKHLPITWVEATLNQPERLADAFAGADVVFHCAASVAIVRKPTADLIATNVQGTRHVLQAVKRAGVGRLVYCSTTVARALSETGAPVTEDMPWNFDKLKMADGYAVTKYQAQRLVVEACENDIDAVIVNPSYMFGPYDAKPSSGAMILNVIKGRIPGHTDGSNNFVDVRDVCEGMIAAWERGKRGESYILGNANLSYREIIEMIARVANVAPPRFVIPKPVATTLGWMGEAVQAITGRDVFVNATRTKYGYCKKLIYSSEKAKRELDYQPGPLETAIADAIEWFRTHGMLR